MRLRRSCALCACGAAWGLRSSPNTTGFSPAMLSRLENGRLIPTLPTLIRIALVFNVGLDYFFTDPRKRHVVAISRRNERKVFPSDPKSARVPWHFETLDFRAKERKLNGFLAHFHSLPDRKHHAAFSSGSRVALPHSRENWK